MSDTPKAACEDCGRPYELFPCDVVLPDAEWLRIHPSGDGGLLCALCIATRAAKLPDTIIVFARIVTAADHAAFAAGKNVPSHDIATLQAALAEAQQETAMARRIEADQFEKRIAAEMRGDRAESEVRRLREALTAADAPSRPADGAPS